MDDIVETKISEATIANVKISEAEIALSNAKADWKLVSDQLNILRQTKINMSSIMATANTVARAAIVAFEEADNEVEKAELALKALKLKRFEAKKLQWRTNRKAQIATDKNHIATNEANRADDSCRECKLTVKEAREHLDKLRNAKIAAFPSVDDMPKAPSYIDDYKTTIYQFIGKQWHCLSIPKSHLKIDMHAYFANYHLIGDPDAVMELWCIGSSIVLQCKRDDIITMIDAAACDLLSASREWCFREM